MATLPAGRLGKMDGEDAPDGRDASDAMACAACASRRLSKSWDRGPYRFLELPQCPLSRSLLQVRPAPSRPRPHGLAAAVTASPLGPPTHATEELRPREGTPESHSVGRRGPSGSSRRVCLTLDWHRPCVLSSGHPCCLTPTAAIMAVPPAPSRQRQSPRSRGREGSKYRSG
jgi:hypothetical protein